MFCNYLIAKEKFQPDFFLYENNKSAAQPIKDQISAELGVPLQYINSALVSAQNRQRFYAHNIPNVPQPEDRGILLRDILESGAVDKEKSYALDAHYHFVGTAQSDKAHNFYFDRHQRQLAFDPIALNVTNGEKSQTIKSQYGKNSATNAFYTSTYGATMVAEPINQTVDCKSFCLDANYWKTIGNPGNILEGGHARCNRSYIAESAGVEVININPSGNGMNGAVIHTNGKSRCLTTNKGEGQKIIEPIRIGTMPQNSGDCKDNQATRIYDAEGKLTTLSANGGGQGAKTGIYAMPLSDREVEYMFRDEKRMEYGYIQNADDDKAKCITSNISKGVPYNIMVERADGSLTPIYEVRNGLITIKGKQYPIKLVDGYYRIRKLTVTECCRLQTMPDDYCKAVSATQGYKGLGNGWTAEVIIHILKHMNIPLDEEIVVLSMYDGIGTGRYCFDKLGYKNITYYSYEIDPYAMKIANSNYPDIIQCGDAFQVRNDDWSLNLH